MADCKSCPIGLSGGKVLVVVSMKNTITHEEIRSAFSEIYNSFYLNNRMTDDRTRTDEEWEKIIEEADILSKKYDSRFVKNMVLALLEEFEYEEKEKKNT